MQLKDYIRLVPSITALSMNQETYLLSRKHKIENNKSFNSTTKLK